MFFFWRKKVEPLPPPDELTDVFNAGNYAYVAMNGEPDRWETCAALGLIGKTDEAIRGLRRFNNPTTDFYRGVAHWIGGDNKAALRILKKIRAPHAENLAALIQKPKIRVLAQLPWFRYGALDLLTAAAADNKFKVDNISFHKDDLPLEPHGDIAKCYDPRTPPDFYIAMMVEWYPIPPNIQDLPCPILGQTADYDLHIQIAYPWLQVFDELVVTDPTEWEDVIRLVSAPVSTFPKTFGVAGNLPPIPTGERGIDSFLTGSVIHPYHIDKAPLLAQFLGLPEEKKAWFIDGFIPEDVYYNILAESKTCFTYIRHPGAMPTRGLEALAMGCAVAVQKGSVLNIWAGEEEGVVTYEYVTQFSKLRGDNWTASGMGRSGFPDARADTEIQGQFLSRAICRVVDEWDKFSQKTQQGAKIVREEFNLPRVASQYLRFLAFLAAKPRNPRKKTEPGKLDQKRLILSKGPLTRDLQVLKKMRKSSMARWQEKMTAEPTPRLYIDMTRELVLECASEHLPVFCKNGASLELKEENKKLLSQAFDIYREGLSRFPDSLPLRFNMIRTAFHFGGAEEVSEALDLLRETLDKPAEHWKIDVFEDVFPWDFFSCFFNYRRYFDLVTGYLMDSSHPEPPLAAGIKASAFYDKTLKGKAQDADGIKASAFYDKTLKGKIQGGFCDIALVKLILASLHYYAGFYEEFPGSSQLADGIPGASQLADGAPGSNQLADGVPGSNQLADGAPGASQLADGSQIDRQAATHFQQAILLDNEFPFYKLRYAEWLLERNSPETYQEAGDLLMDLAQNSILFNESLTLLENLLEKKLYENPQFRELSGVLRRLKESIQIARGVDFNIEGSEWRWDSLQQTRKPECKLDKDEPVEEPAELVSRMRERILSSKNIYDLWEISNEAPDVFQELNKDYCEKRDKVIKSLSKYGVTEIICDEASFVDFHYRKLDDKKYRFYFLFKAGEKFEKDWRIYFHGHINEKDIDFALFPQKMKPVAVILWRNRKSKFMNWDFSPDPPTTLWKKGEYVIVTREISAQPMPYAMNIGFYRETDGNLGVQVRLGRIDLGAEPEIYDRDYFEKVMRDISETRNIFHLVDIKNSGIRFKMPESFQEIDKKCDEKYKELLLNYNSIRASRDKLFLANFHYEKIGEESYKFYFLFRLKKRFDKDCRMFFHTFVKDEFVHMLPDDRQKHKFENWDFHPNPPTSSWAENDYMTITREIRANPIPYHIKVGFFRPEEGNYDRETDLGWMNLTFEIKDCYHDYIEELIGKIQKTKNVYDLFDIKKGYEEIDNALPGIFGKLNEEYEKKSRELLTKFHSEKTISERASFVDFNYKRINDEDFKLYLLFKTKKGFEKDWRIFIHAHVKKEKARLLPKERQEHGYDNWDFNPEPPTSLWKKDHYILVTSVVKAKPIPYEIKFGFFREDEGNHGELIDLGWVDFASPRSPDFTL